MDHTDYFIELHTGQKMPMIGLGTWKSEPEKVKEAVEYAVVDAGYRHIDCASIYKNEKEIGEAFHHIFESKKVTREELFVTSKLWNTDHAKDDVVRACKQTLHDLQLEYLDLYLVHWCIASSSTPVPDPVDDHGFLITEKISMRETWEAMENLVHQGFVKAIGVANFTAPMLFEILSFATIPPAVNQIELHPYNQQQGLVDFCQYNNIPVTAYSSLGSPGNAKGQGDMLILLEDPTVQHIAQTYKKSAAQVLLRWGIQRNTIVIPKSVTKENIQRNVEIFDFELSLDDMTALSQLERHHRYVDPFGWWKIPYFG
ncbi:MAG: aldo/keto reductase [Candidatus Magasanikbacteria bacterium]|nr:aldo/keto reductase [Candidatus Magasanikbacteria bacterium]